MFERRRLPSRTVQRRQRAAGEGREPQRAPEVHGENAVRSHQQRRWPHWLEDTAVIAEVGSAAPTFA